MSTSFVGHNCFHGPVVCKRHFRAHLLLQHASKWQHCLGQSITVLRSEHRVIKSINQPPYAVCEAALSTVGSREVGRVLPTLFINSARRRVVYQPVSGLKTICNDADAVTKFLFENSDRLHSTPHPLPMNCGQSDVVLGQVELPRAIAPRVPVSGQPVHREAGQRVPPLVLIDVKVLRILHWVDSVLARARRWPDALNF